MNAPLYWENYAMMPVAPLRPVRIQHIFPIPTARWIFMSALGIRIPLANSSLSCSGIFKGVSQDGGRSNFSKISAPHSLLTTYRLITPSSRSISLDSTFKFIQQTYTLSLEYCTPFDLLCQPPHHFFSSKQITPIICRMRHCHFVLNRPHHYIIGTLEPHPIGRGSGCHHNRLAVEWSTPWTEKRGAGYRGGAWA
jgi:hypothetical protein